MGPTASGKTGLAEAVADELGAVLVNADAFQIYRGLDIGTAKPAVKERYRLLDLKEPSESFGLGEWLKLAQAELEFAFEKGRHVIFVGGTGLYVRALFEEYAAIGEAPDPEVRRELSETPIENLREVLRADHPEIAARVDMANPLRVRRALERVRGGTSDPVVLPPFIKMKLTPSVSEAELNRRIEHRTLQMVQNGWVQEIQGLQKQGFSREDPGFRAIGYEALWDHLDRKISLDEAITTTIVESRRYAKRQRTWLRREPNLVELSGANENEAFRKAMERIGSFLV